METESVRIKKSDHIWMRDRLSSKNRFIRDVMSEMIEIIEKAEGK